MRRRTKLFGIRAIELTESLPKGRVSEVLGRQLLRSGTSVGANYRAALRGKSRRDFIAKLCIVEEELDESMYWMELLVDSGVLKPEKIDPLMKEADELLAIVVSSVKTAKREK